MTRRRLISIAGLSPFLKASAAPSLYRGIKAYLDSIPGIDTHDHLRPFDRLSGYVQTERGMGMNLFGLLNTSYFQRTHSLTPWKPGQTFNSWWPQAKRDFDNARATGVYRYLLPAFRDLYGVDFDNITDQQAQDLDERIFKNYRNDKWLIDVVTRRSNIELMLIDPYWEKFDLRTFYKFGVLVLDVSTLSRGFHPAEVENLGGDPYRVAEKWGQAVTSLDDYLEVIDRLCMSLNRRGR